VVVLHLLCKFELALCKDNTEYCNI
jgi:hypothetical protein